MKYSQEYIAAKLNISQQAYSRMENAPQNISIQRMYELALVLGVNIHTLVCEEDFHVLQNVQHRNGKQNTAIVLKGLTDTERDLYEDRINELSIQLKLLQDLVQKFKL